MQPSVDPQFAMMVVIVGVGGLVSMLSGISVIWANLKRKPPLDQELYRDFVRRSEMEGMRMQFCDQIKSLDERHQKTAGEIFHVLRKLKDDLGQQSTHIENSLNSVARELGELKGGLNVHINGEKGRG